MTPIKAANGPDLCPQESVGHGVAGSELFRVALEVRRRDSTGSRIFRSNDGGAGYWNLNEQLNGTGHDIR